jgi:hypothetical protein
MVSNIGCVKNDTNRASKTVLKGRKDGRGHLEDNKPISKEFTMELSIKVA